MKKFRTIFVLSCVLFATGCNSYMVDSRAIKPAVDKLVERHDKYITKDNSLSEIEKEIFLMSSDNLKKTIDEAALGKE